jgi:hypothetical protein
VNDRWVRRLILGWLCAGIALALLQRPLTDVLWILAPLAGAAYLALGVCLAVYTAWRAFGPARAPRSTVLLASAAVLGLTFVAVPLARLGHTLTTRTRYWLHHDDYSRITDSVLAARALKPDSLLEFNREDDYYVDPGPPVRLAFIQPGGFLDNWEGVVYDPTGVVEAAQGWTFASGEQEFTAPLPIRRLFGGDLVGCERIEGPWYRCWFT